ncbi:MAG: hypothetical protein V3S30_02805 [Thermoanaerobaculia bacterium]
MKHIVWVLAVLLCVAGSAFAGVEKYCERYESSYCLDLGEVPKKTFIPARVQFYLAPIMYDGWMTIGIYQPLESDSRFRGPAKTRRECYNDNDELIYKKTVKDRKPNIFTDADDPTKMSRGWMFTYPFSLEVNFNYYCIDSLWVKKANMMAKGEQTYVEQYQGGDDGEYGCEVPVQFYQLPSSD